MQLAHLRVRVVEIAEDDGFGGAGLLAGREHLAVADPAILQAGVDAGALDPLHAIGALLHDAARAHRHVRVEGHLLRVGVVRRVREEVEPADLVRAVVRAVPRADAPVVDHLVEALVAVDGRVDGAHVLAGRIFAVHAHQRLEDDAGVPGIVAGEVAVDAQPVHFAALRHLLLADHRNVVLGDAGDHAGAAAGAAREIDRHAPSVPGVAVPRVCGQERAPVLGQLLAGLLQFRHGSGGRDQPTLHRVVLLRLRDQRSSADSRDRQARRKPGVVAVAQGAGVESQITTERFARSAAPVSEGDGDAVLGMTRREHDRSVRRRPAEAEIDALTLAEAELLRGVRRDQRRVLPGDLRHRIRQFLQPGDVAESAVPNAVVRDDVDLQAWRRLRRRDLHRRGEDLLVAHCRRFRACRRARDEAVGEPFLPVERELAGPLRLPELAQLRVRRAIALAEKSGERLGLAHAGIERRDQRLHEGDGPVVRPRVAPALQRM